MTNKSLIFKNTFFLYIRSFFVLIIGLYSSRLILENLGISDFGIYNAVGGVISMVSFINTSLLAAYQRYYNTKLIEGRDILMQWFGASIYAQGLLLLVIIMLAETVGLWFLNNYMTIPNERVLAANWVFQASVFSVVFTVLQAPYAAMITAYEKMNAFAMISIYDSVMKLVIIYSLLYINSDTSIYTQLL